MSTPVTLDAFNACSIPRGEWDHRAHLTVAYLLLRAHGLDGATLRMREGVQRYNARWGIEQTETGGYHDTMTIAWVRILHAVMVAYGPGADAEAFLAEHPYLLSRFLLRLYYSRPRIMCAGARAGWVEPDLAPLPSPPAGGVVSCDARHHP
ncbi:MAG: hypothetical protein U0637_15465 [Phycisphaerales bacterium]